MVHEVASVCTVLFCPRLVVQAVDKGSPPLSTTTVIRVQVVDANDNSPAIPPMEPVLTAESKTHIETLQFLRLFFLISTFFLFTSFPCLFDLSTDLPAGYMVTQVVANDVDMNSVITYSFSDNTSANSPFAIDRYTGVVSLSRSLDYEEQTEFTLAVSASDSVHHTTGQVKVQVVDVNDNTPVFTQVSYQVQVTFMLFERPFASCNNASSNNVVITALE